MLGAAVRRVDPGEAETLLRRAYNQATTDGEYQLASTTAGELVTLLRDQGRIREALSLANQKETDICVDRVAISGLTKSCPECPC